MANSFNQAIILGYLGKDAESFKDGTVIRLRIATSYNYKKNDVWQNKTEWHTILAFQNYLADCKKGDLLHVVGKLRYNEKSEAHISADSVIIVRRKSGETRPNENPTPDLEIYDEENDPF